MGSAEEPEGQVAPDAHHNPDVPVPEFELQRVEQHAAGDDGGVQARGRRVRRAGPEGGGLGEAVRPVPVLRELQELFADRHHGGRRGGDAGVEGVGGVAAAAADPEGGEGHVRDAAVPPAPERVPRREQEGAGVLVLRGAAAEAGDADAVGAVRHVPHDRGVQALGDAVPDVEGEDEDSRVARAAEADSGVRVSERGAAGAGAEGGEPGRAGWVGRHGGGAGGERAGDGVAGGELAGGAGDAAERGEGVGGPGQRGGGAVAAGEGEQRREQEAGGEPAAGGGGRCR